jgi:hypothetical protein
VGGYGLSLTKPIIASLLLITLLSTNLIPVAAIDTLHPSDFALTSFSKNIDYFDYVRAAAQQHNVTPPDEESHAFLHLNYINVSGLQMLYAGLSNITANQTSLTIPIQTFMMHYQSSAGLNDVIIASSFIMMMAFNETNNTVFPDSPDKNDLLYASFSLGTDLTAIFGSDTPPRQSSTTEIIPLTSEDEYHWSWGMRYTNLTAIWWQISIDPANPHHDPRPIAITRYEELTFTYHLTIDPETGTATLNTEYVIGRTTDLWLLFWLIVLPIPFHYNATGCYRMNGVKISDEIVHEFLQTQGIKMSIVQFQSSVVLDRTTYSNTEGINVHDNDVFVDDTTVTTYSDDGERIFDADFTAKKTYKVFNFTSDPTETTYETYDTTTRTTKIAGFARNPIFHVHTYLMRYIPLMLATMSPELVEQAKEHLFDMSYADYFYIIGYPVYDGYRIEHDPTYVAYASLTSEEAPPPDTRTLPPGGIVLGIAGVALIFVVVFIIRRK